MIAMFVIHIQISQHHLVFTQFFIQQRTILTVLIGFFIIIENFLFQNQIFIKLNGKFLMKKE